MEWRSRQLTIGAGLCALLLAFVVGERLERTILTERLSISSTNSSEPRAMLQPGEMLNSIANSRLVALPLNQWAIDADGRYVYRSSLYSTFDLEKVEGKFVLDWGSFVEIGLAEDANGYYLVRVEPQRVSLYFSVMGEDRVLLREVIPEEPLSTARFQIQLTADSVTLVHGMRQYDLVHGFNLTRGKVSVLTNLRSIEIAYLNVLPRFTRVP